MEGKDEIKEGSEDETTEDETAEEELEYDSLTVEDKIQLLKKEIKKIQHEIAISNLVYNCHGEDTFEDLFRDNVPLLEEKINGILFAIDNLKNGF
jgi:hypothetical protein